MVIKGIAYEFFFRNTDDPIKQRIWTERMEPIYDNFPTVNDFYDSYIESFRILG